MRGATSRVLRAPRWELPADFTGQDRPVVTVSAPAGYGKTTLLAEWRQDVTAMGCKVVSLVVDADDRDGDRLTFELLHAFSPADSRRSQMLLGGVGDHGKRAIIMALLAEMASRTQQTVLFIDDVHWLGDAAAESILRLLIAQQPERLALVLSGRSNAALLASESLLADRMHRYGAHQLTFNEAEVAELLRQYGVEPRPSLVKNIVERTQGWPAVVRLIAMTLQEGERNQDSFLEGLVERRQALTEYLSDVLLARLPVRCGQFLLGISLFRRFSVHLAAATTGMEDAGKLLDELERRALPLSPSGDTGLPYSLHPLVREFLLARLRKDNPANLRRITSSALVWLTAHHRIDAAIDLSLDVEDVEAAAGLIDRFARNAARHYGRHATFLYWCNKIPKEYISRFPQIQVVRIWSLNVMRRYSEADQIMADLEEQSGTSSNSEGAGQAVTGPPARIPELVELEQCIQLTLRDQWVHLTPKVMKWLVSWPDADRLNRGMAYTMIGCGESACSKFDSAIENFRMGRRLMGECNAHYVVAWANMWAAVALTKQGNYRQALHECEEAVSHVASHLGGQTPAEIMLHALRSLLLYEQNRLEEASAALEHGLTALVEQSSVDSMIMGYVALARLQNARRSHLDALETLAEGEVLGWSHELPRLAIALTAERIDLLLRQGEAGQAAQIWQELRQAVQRRASSGSELALKDKACRIEARLALAKGAYSAAFELVVPALQQATETGQKRKQVELLLLQARALEGQGDRASAQALFERALDVAMPQGYVRVFADEGESIKPLLSGYLDSRRDAGRSAKSEYVEQLTEALEIERSRPGGSGVHPALTLTRREIKILEKLQSGLSNRELADALFITEGTLKWHLKNIYGKLSVTNRVAAIAAGRECGFLS